MESLKRDLPSCTISASTVILDIEGTTTSISFVKDILFPYIRSNLEKFLNQNWSSDKLKEHIKALRIQAQQDEENKVEGVIPIPEEGEDDALKLALIDNIKWQMTNDRKTKSLKDLQGLIMEEGYKAGDLKGHVYDDVERSLKTWSEQNKSIYIYSSGSIQAQKLLFGYSEKGDMLPLIKGHFDTNVGMKGDASSYQEILKQISTSSSDVAFFTDVPAEARAAKEAGIVAILVSREGNVPLSDQDKTEFQVITSFEDVEFENKCKKMKICPENPVTNSNKEIENCSFSIEDREKPDSLIQNSVQSEKPSNNEKTCDGVSNLDELMDVDDSSSEKKCNNDAKNSDDIKQEDSSIESESKDEESAKTMEEESAVNNQDKSLEIKKEVSTEIMKEGSIDSMKEDLVDSIKQNPVEIKKEELVQSMKEESLELKDESVVSIKEKLAESNKEEPNENIKQNPTENTQGESNEINKGQSVQNKIEVANEDKKEVSVDSMNEKSPEIEKGESIQSIKEASVEMKEVSAESMKVELAEEKKEEPNEKLQQNSTEKNQEESNERNKEESVQNKVESTNEDKKKESNEIIKEETTEIKDKEPINTNDEMKNSNSEGDVTSTTAIKNDENVASIGTQKKDDIASISDSKTNNLNEDLAVAIDENNRAENCDGLKTLNVDNQDQNLTENDTKKTSRNEESMEFENKDNHASHLDVPIDLIEDKKPDENPHDKNINANDHFTSDICEKIESDETVFKKTVMEESQKKDCITTNGLEETQKYTAEICGRLDYKPSSETNNENLKSISQNGQMVNGDSKPTNECSTPDLVKDSGCCEEVSSESKKCDNSESTSLESVVEA